MNWYKIFYWLTVADNMKDFFIVGIIFFTLAFAICGIWAMVESANPYYTDDDELRSVKVVTKLRKWLWLVTPFAVLFWLMFLLTPSKSDTIFIIAGGAVGNFITSDTNAKQIPPDLMLFIRTKIKAETLNLNDDVKRELNLQTPKEKLLDKLKDLTKEQIIEQLKSDTTLKTN